jgi:thiol:disulfide interchange protein DsbD
MSHELVTLEHLLASLLDNSDIQKLIKDKNIALVRADWTNQDLEITKALARYGKAGVPLNVVYTPKQAPQVLPTLLTASLVQAALDR